ncbi:hypothetical protein H4S01_006045, partial [Coemansia sp. RSA 2610]
LPPLIRRPPRTRPFCALPPAAPAAPRTTAINARSAMKTPWLPTLAAWPTSKRSLASTCQSKRPKSATAPSRSPPSPPTSTHSPSSFRMQPRRIGTRALCRVRMRRRLAARLPRSTCRHTTTWARSTSRPRVRPPSTVNSACTLVRNQTALSFGRRTRAIRQSSIFRPT